MLEKRTARKTRIGVSYLGTAVLLSYLGTAALVPYLGTAALDYRALDYLELVGSNPGTYLGSDPRLGTAECLPFVDSLADLAALL